MSSFSPWGGLGELEEACVKWGGKESTLGAHAPTRRTSPKIRPSWKVVPIHPPPPSTANNTLELK